MEFRTHVGVSVNGFLADANGKTAWYAVGAYNPADHGHDEFTADSAAVVIGRSSFDQGWPFWKDGDWPYHGKQVYVLSSTPLPEGTERYGVRKSEGGVKGLIQQLEAEVTGGFVHVLGGGKTLRAFIDKGAMNHVCMVVLPIHIWSGIPLFPTTAKRFSSQAWLDSLEHPPARPLGSEFKLESYTPYPSGAIELHYSFEQ